MSIKFALLGLLAEQPRGVGQLRHDFEEATRHTWPINVGQVFQTIQRLERDGLIAHAGTETGETGRTAEIYAITDAGTAELRQWFDTPSVRPRDDRDELVIKTAIAAHIDAAGLTEMIQRQREATMAELREITRLKAATLPERTADRLLFERRIFDLEAEARWLDHVETLQAPKEAQ